VASIVRRYELGVKVWFTGRLRYYWVDAPAVVHATAYAVHPERFAGGLLQSPARPTEAWIIDRFRRPRLP
jgi:hypothetical protein